MFEPHSCAETKRSQPGVNHLHCHASCWRPSISSKGMLTAPLRRTFAKSAAGRSSQGRDGNHSTVVMRQPEYYRQYE